MEHVNIITAVLILLASFAVQADVLENKKNIEEHKKILKEKVQKDLMTLEEKIDTLIEKMNESIEGLKVYVDSAIQELTNHTATELKKVHDLVMVNMNNLSDATADQRTEMISWTHTRHHLHEDILKTEVALCVHDHGQLSSDTVKFQSEDGGYIDNHYSWRVFNRTCSDADCAKEILDRDTGKFTVPRNAAGVYMFTFTVIMDTWDTGLESFAYVFRKNEELINGTDVFSEVSNHDNKIPGSRTIFLKLEDGDQVDVFQTNPDPDVMDSAVSFCGALVHLEKVTMILLRLLGCLLSLYISNPMFPGKSGRARF